MDIFFTEVTVELVTKDRKKLLTEAAFSALS